MKSRKCLTSLRSSTGFLLPAVSRNYGGHKPEERLKICSLQETDMLHFLAKSTVDFTVSIPQSDLNILVEGKFEIM